MVHRTFATAQSVVGSIHTRVCVKLFVRCTQSLVFVGVAAGARSFVTETSSDRAMAVSCCTSYTCTLALATRQACPLTHLISAHELDARGHVLYRLLEFGPGRIVPHECLQTIP